jgi:hypothetical protein
LAFTFPTPFNASNSFNTDSFVMVYPLSTI